MYRSSTVSKSIFIVFLFVFTMGLTCTSVYAHQNSRYIYEDSKLKYIQLPSSNQLFVYKYDQNGNIVKIEKVKTPSVVVPSKVSISDVSYEVIAYGVSPTAKSVQFPTWTELNGQDDLVHPYVEGEKVAPGIWKATVLLSKHNMEKGVYYNDVWVDGKFFGGAVTKVEDNVRVSLPQEIGYSAGGYEVVVTGVGKDVAKIVMPVWTAQHEQDDIKHVEAQKIEDGTWKAKIKFSDHNDETGTYITHIYAHDKHGNQMPLYGGETKVKSEVKAPPTLSYSSGSYEVIAYGVSPTAKSVQFPTWTDLNGQDDLAHPYVEGEKVAPGIWKATVLLSKHNMEKGVYYNDVWVDGKYFGGAVTKVEDR
ncbi:GBS Bsp-like repeat-containing protein [Paenibacillus assamensis]|uniref:GBS Bsp-like repeat-containing protein n=1 Tax=Paenibacillus assamensis TaxID=311244 RepID=UPI000424A40F|nr:GBS Bsp-like repeat-containing protein [Paenibacillus assamensis]